MSSDAELHTAAELQLAYKVANAQLNPFPYPHFYVQNVFPPKFYETLQKNLPEHSSMLPIVDARPVYGMKERFVMALKGPQVEKLPEEQSAFWTTLNQWMVGGRFGALVVSRFEQLIQQRFQTTQIELYDEALLIEDHTNYRLGPHTDAEKKVISFLFYLPKDESQSHLGTSIYVPKQPQFRCPGGPHYPRDQFDVMHTMPFVPNSLFAFLKTDVSFHGVETVQDENCRRWLLLYDMYVNLASVRAAAPAAPAQAASSMKFSF